VSSSSTDDPDGNLVKRIASGDGAAAQELIDRHLSAIIGVGFRMLGSRTEAEDIAQEVFLKVWTNAAKWQPGQAKYSTWLHRVAMNQCLDRLRKRREVLMDTLPEREDESPNALETLQSTEQSDQVQRAINTLPDRQRTAITLCHFQGMSNLEASEVMSISVEALESLLSRARRGLKDKLMHKREELLSY
jgi:RNA polymerase sigma-70 factor (ECF subfamily)